VRLAPAVSAAALLAADRKAAAVPWTSRNPRDITLLFGQSWEQCIERIRETQFFTRVCPHGKRAPDVQINAF